MAKKGTVFCEYCERAYLPAISTAENPQLYCCQACENSDLLEEGGVEND